jgi:hypothetical protein
MQLKDLIQKQVDNALHTWIVNKIVNNVTFKCYLYIITLYE